MEQVDVYEAKTHLSALLNRVEQGEEIVIARSGRPVARLVPLRGGSTRRAPGSMRGQISIADDFDQTPADVISAFEGVDAADEAAP